MKKKVNIGYAGANDKQLLDFYYWLCLWDKKAPMGDIELTKG